ncbi:MAG: hypothetical protein WD009_04890 [Phycisphaeraceae bacterium]
MTSTQATSWQSPYAAWSHGPPREPGFFPILVWAQDPALAREYQAIGVNTFFSLHQGPTQEQLDRLRDAGLYAICRQNEVSLADGERGDSPIIAWMHGDEPDNRRPNADGSMGGPRDPAEIERNGQRMRETDPTRPIVVNFGQGVANDDFPGRGATLEQYPLYARGADIVSYDVYPVANIKRPGPDGKTILDPNGADYLWYVAKGVERLRGFVDDRKPVWNVLESTHIHNPERIATPHQVRAETWMSVIHGSRGLCWFVHDFREGHRNPAALLANDTMREAVARINREVTELAPVINGPAVAGAVNVEATDAEAGAAGVAVTVRRHEGALYVFAVGMRNRPMEARFALAAGAAKAVEVVGEGRTIAGEGTGWRDAFDAYDVRIYRIAE